MLNSTFDDESKARQDIAIIAIDEASDLGGCMPLTRTLDGIANDDSFMSCEIEENFYLNVLL